MIKRLIKLYKEKKNNDHNDEFFDYIKEQVSVLGDNIIVYGKVDVFFGNKISIGNNCKINAGVLLNGRSGITIGNNVTLSFGAKLISTGYDIDHWIETGERIHIANKPIYIGDNCWIGADAIILPGVNITGEYVVVAAGAVVTKNITENRVLVAGNPAKIVKHYDKNNQE